MRITVETSVENAQDFIGWAMSKETGRPVLILISGVQRVRVELAPADVKELCCQGIYAQALCVQKVLAAKGNPAGAAAGLVDADGVPLRTVS